MKLCLSAMGMLAMGCSQIPSNKVDPSEVYTAYTATYNENNNTLAMEASFNVGGSTGTSVDLQSPSKVTYAGQPLAKSTTLLNEILYQSKTKTSHPSSQTPLTIVYTDTNGKAYTNVLRIPDAVSVLTPPASIFSKGAGITVSWGSMTPTASNESITANIVSEGQTGSQVSSSTLPLSASASGTVDFNPQDLINLPTGPAQIYVCRTDTGTPSQVPGVGGYVSETYCSPYVPVTINP